MERRYESIGCGRLNAPEIPEVPEIPDDDGLVLTDAGYIDTPATALLGALKAHFVRYVYDARPPNTIKVASVFVRAVQSTVLLVGELLILRCRVRRNTWLCDQRGVVSYNTAPLMARIAAIEAMIPASAECVAPAEIRDLTEREREAVTHYLHHSGVDYAKDDAVRDVLQRVVVCAVDVARVRAAVFSACCPDIGLYTDDAMAARVLAHETMCLYESDYMVSSLALAARVRQRARDLRTLCNKLDMPRYTPDVLNAARVAFDTDNFPRVVDGHDLPLAEHHKALDKMFETL